MKTVPAQVIDEVWQRVNDSTPDRARALAERMQQEQPFVMVYLLAAEENALDEDERGSLLMLGATIWEVMSEGNPALRQVTDTELEAAEEANVKVLQKMEEDSEIANMEAMRRLISDYNQMPLLGAVVEALMEGHENEPDMAPDNLGLSLIYLKTIIDCFDQ